MTYFIITTIIMVSYYATFQYNSNRMNDRQKSWIFVKIQAYILEEMMIIEKRLRLEALNRDAVEAAGLAAFDLVAFERLATG